MQPLWVLIGAIVLLCACEVDIEGPCIDEDCSGHGVCVLVEQRGESVPWCRCESGYMVSPDGLTCYLPGGPPADADVDR